MKNKFLVLGSFRDRMKQLWSSDISVYESAKEFIKEHGPDHPIVVHLARELDIDKSIVELYAERNPKVAMDALIRVVQMNPDNAVKVVGSLREAELFMNLVEQLEEKAEKQRLREMSKDRLIY